MIEARSLTKVFSGSCAVEDLSFRVEPGQVLGFLGPNGAGKTTTIKLLLGLLYPTSGSASVAGLDPQADPVGAKRVCGYLPDVPFLYDHLTPNETIAFLGGLYALPPAESARRARQMWDELDLGDRADELIAGLSKGTKKKVALGMALLHRPSVLLLDEPTSGLDPQTVRIFKDRVKAESAAGASIILSSHVLEVVAEVATHLLIISQGKQVLLAPMDQAMARAKDLGITLEGLFLDLTAPGASTARTAPGRIAA